MKPLPQAYVVSGDITPLLRNKYILFFYQEDCAPCEAVKPLVSELATSEGFPISYLDVKDPVNVPEVERYRVKAAPTVVVVTNDREMNEVGRLYGKLLITEFRLRRLLAQ